MDVSAACDYRRDSSVVLTWRIEPEEVYYVRLRSSIRSITITHLTYQFFGIPAVLIPAEHSNQSVTITDNVLLPTYILAML